MPNTKAYCLMAPTAIEFYAPSKYNTGVSKSQYEGMCYIYEQLKDITPVNAYAEMAAHTDEYLYFRSDHHWTTLGAYYAYRTFAKVAGFTPVDKTLSRPASSRRSSGFSTKTRRAPRSRTTPTMLNISFRP